MNAVAPENTAEALPLDPGQRSGHLVTGAIQNRAPRRRIDNEVWISSEEPVLSFRPQRRAGRQKGR
ncbi:hypothetical protein ASZ90_016519 [hydrocarbon metagenome]|uniref:Uncharacterized protein n=1 Tax=hydrocarbon metagenome TaxID=938273 RepID=A0A0W8EQZ5_9ZZZZ